MTDLKIASSVALLMAAVVGILSSRYSRFLDNQLAICERVDERRVTAGMRQFVENYAALVYRKISFYVSVLLSVVQLLVYTLVERLQLATIVVVALLLVILFLYFMQWNQAGTDEVLGKRHPITVIPIVLPLLGLVFLLLS